MIAYRIKWNGKHCHLTMIVSMVKLKNRRNKKILKLIEAKQLNQDVLKTKYENFDIVTANLTVQLQKASQIPSYDYSAYMKFANDIELYSM